MWKFVVIISAVLTECSTLDKNFGTIQGKNILNDYDCFISHDVKFKYSSFQDKIHYGSASLDSKGWLPKQDTIKHTKPYLEMHANRPTHQTGLNMIHGLTISGRSDWYHDYPLTVHIKVCSCEDFCLSKQYIDLGKAFEGPKPLNNRTTIIFAPYGSTTASVIIVSTTWPSGANPGLRVGAVRCNKQMTPTEKIHEIACKTNARSKSFKEFCRPPFCWVKCKCTADDNVDQLVAMWGYGKYTEDTPICHASMHFFRQSFMERHPFQVFLDIKNAKYHDFYGMQCNGKATNNYTKDYMCYSFIPTLLDNQ